MPRNQPLLYRVMLKMERDGDCLLFTGSTLTNSEYGIIFYKGKRVPVHRAVWEEVNGPIPEGMTLDHACERQRCVNVLHLQVVTRGENTRLRWERNPPPDTCKRGHSAWRYNTVRSGKEKGRVIRRCVTCQKDYDKERANAGTH